MFFACGIWFVANVSSVRPSSKQTGSQLVEQNKKRLKMFTTLNNQTPLHMQNVFSGISISFSTSISITV